MSSQTGNIAEALAYQIKKEIAENYFGTRKDLEEERDDLITRGKKIQKAWGKEVLPWLIKIFELLIEEESGRAFLTLINREDLIGPITLAIKNHGADQPLKIKPAFALTSKCRYGNLLFKLYLKAGKRGKRYNEEIKSLHKRITLYNEDLTRFNCCYNFSDILSFIKSLEGADALKGVLGGTIDSRAIPDLEGKMILKPLDLSREGVTIPGVLPRLFEIKGALGLLIDKIFDRYGAEIKEILHNLKKCR